MRRVQVFEAPDVLKRQLQAFEQAADDETRAIRATFQPVFTRREVLKTNELAQLWELVLVNTAGGNRTLLLPALTLADAGKQIIIVKTSGTNTLTVRPVAGKIQTAASIALTSMNAYHLVADGADYWREF